LFRNANNLFAWGLVPLRPPGVAQEVGLVLFLSSVLEQAALKECDLTVYFDAPYHPDSGRRRGVLRYSVHGCLLMVARCFGGRIFVLIMALKNFPAA
jgi:hypothetical protein